MGWFQSKWNEMTKQSKKQKQKQHQQIQEQEENGNKENTDNGIIKSSGQSFQTDENFDENNPGKK